MIQYSQLVHQVSRFADYATGTEARTPDLLNRARALLQKFADQYAELAEPACQYRTAVPTGESMLAAHAASPMPGRFTVVGSDGSSIPPDRHSGALYYLINVGSLVYRHGSGQMPVSYSKPDLRFEDCDLYEGAAMIDESAVEVRRAIAELEHLASVAGAEPRGEPVVALIDGTLLLWTTEDRSRDRQQDKVKEYVHHLGRLRKAGVATAGFVSRPWAHDVIRLLWMASLGENVSWERMEQNELASLPDRRLFEFLAPGERSTCFINAQAANALYAEAGHQIYFFYLNVGSPEAPELARVEVPEWVYQSPESLDCVHGAILAQCKLVGRYPYVLTRAHEMAVVNWQERAQVQRMVEAALLQRGIHSQPSQKAMLKSMVADKGRSPS